MRKFILLAGTAFAAVPAPAFACDYHLLDGPRRFNAFAAATDVPWTPQGTASEDQRQLPQSEVAPEPSGAAGEVPAAPADSAGAAPGDAIFL